MISATSRESGSSTYSVPRTRSAQKFPSRPADRRAMPRTSATASAMPTAAEMKLWNASWLICEKYDIVDSPAVRLPVRVRGEGGRGLERLPVGHGRQRLRVEREEVLESQRHVGQQHGRGAEEQHRARVTGPVLVLLRVHARQPVERHVRAARASVPGPRTPPPGSGRGAWSPRGRRARRGRSGASRWRSCQNRSGLSRE